MVCKAFWGPFTSLALLLSLLLQHISLANGAAVEFRTVLAPRQNPTTAAAAADAPSALAVSCADYSRIANLSTIALNGTLRGAFLRSSPLGTFPAAHILDAEKPKLMALKFDASLNRQCGNLSALAIAEADRNLTQGIVAGMRILAAPGVDPGNLALPVLAILFIFLMGLPATAL
ncbi:hypothetical protein F5Y17DRAFT_456072 [Xylariaceae sp. FL0594]|nr:hypothetical protein F5Y17DRAFT_456072 [Xylariaceae sp. FL0594]